MKGLVSRAVAYFQDYNKEVCESSEVKGVSPDGDNAVGVDGVAQEDYGNNVEENLRDLSERMKRMAYRPQPKRRSYVPKAGSDRGHPLGISCFEDKLVEMAVKRVLEQIYEEVFEACSHGRSRSTRHRSIVPSARQKLRPRKHSFILN